MSLERANRVCELRVSEEESVIRCRKQSFHVNQHVSADKQFMTIIEAVLEYNFGNLRTLLQSSPIKEFRVFNELSQGDQFSHP